MKPFLDGVVLMQHSTMYHIRGSTDHEYREGMVSTSIEIATLSGKEYLMDRGNLVRWRDDPNRLPEITFRIAQRGDPERDNSTVLEQITDEAEIQRLYAEFEAWLQEDGD